MPRYAQFNPSQQDPKSVTGWYDTDELHYPALPDMAHMIKVTDAQWNLHLTVSPDGWSVSNGKIAGPGKAAS